MKTYRIEHTRPGADDPCDEWVPAEVAQRLYDALDRITKSGSWFITALEIDVPEDGAMDGEELERLALDALAAADGEEV